MFRSLVHLTKQKESKEWCPLFIAAEKIFAAAARQPPNASGHHAQPLTHTTTPTTKPHAKIISTKARLPTLTAVPRQLALGHDIHILITTVSYSPIISSPCHPPLRLSILSSHLPICFVVLVLSSPPSSSFSPFHPWGLL